MYVCMYVSKYVRGWKPLHSVYMYVGYVIYIKNKNVYIIANIFCLYENDKL